MEIGLISKTTVTAEALFELAADAFWAVEWHRKNGYKRIGYKRADANNVDSYVYRKQLAAWSLYSIGAFCLCRYYYTRLLNALR